MGYGSGWHGDGVTKARNEPVPGGAYVGRSMTEPSGAACSERKRRGRRGTSVEFRRRERMGFSSGGGLHGVREGLRVK